MGIPRIATARLTLRPFCEQDSRALHLILAEDGILRYFSNSYAPSPAQVQNLIDSQLRHWREHGFGWWAFEPLVHKIVTGWSGLQYLPDSQEIEIGYLLSRSFWWKGLATEAAMAGLRFGFESLQMERIVGVVPPGMWRPRESWRRSACLS